MTEFARYLGVNGALLSQWMKGTRQPGRRKAPVLAAKLGPEIYDLLGLARPDSDLREINLVWGQLSKEQRREAVRRVKELAEKGYRGEIT